ncbi:MAG: hypothetical protein HC860_17530 [Alkalinema sp. RU_4_3]|nr:hypothetical protein [Alkalinema sp. RU_4_3]
MQNWIQVQGQVKRGHGVASGKSGDRRFPQGTIAMQKPYFAERGLDLHPYFSGTINISIAPLNYLVKQAKHTFRALKWSADGPAEDFSFFDCRLILLDDRRFDGLIYYPHPETKPEHFQDPEILEVMMPLIEGLDYGDRLVLAIDRTQIELITPA